MSHGEQSASCHRRQRDRQGRARSRKRMSNMWICRLPIPLSLTIGLKGCRSRLFDFPSDNSRIRMMILFIHLLSNFPDLFNDIRFYPFLRLWLFFFYNDNDLRFIYLSVFISLSFPSQYQGTFFFLFLVFLFFYNFSFFLFYSLVSYLPAVSFPAFSMSRIIIETWKLPVTHAGEKGWRNTLGKT